VQAVVIPAGHRDIAWLRLPGNQLLISGETIDHPRALDVIERDPVIVLGCEPALVPVGQLRCGVEQDRFDHAIAALRRNSTG